jgi:hypothetical protein
VSGKKTNTPEFILPSRKKSYVSPKFNVLTSKQAEAKLAKAFLNDASVKGPFESVLRADNGGKKPARGSAAEVNRGRG